MAVTSPANPDCCASPGVSWHLLTSPVFSWHLHIFSSQSPLCPWKSPLILSAKLLTNQHFITPITAINFHTAYKYPTTCHLLQDFPKNYCDKGHLEKSTRSQISSFTTSRSTKYLLPWRLPCSQDYEDQYPAFTLGITLSRRVRRKAISPMSNS